MGDSNKPSVGGYLNYLWNRQKLPLFYYSCSALALVTGAILLLGPWKEKPSLEVVGWTLLISTSILCVLTGFGLLLCCAFPERSHEEESRLVSHV